MEIKPAMVAIAAFVVITVIAAVLMPVLGDATKTEDTYTNEGYFFMEKYDADTDVVMVWDYENPNILTVNDVNIDMSNRGFTGNVTVLFCENAGARLYYNLTGCQFMWASGTAAADVGDNEKLTVTCSNGSISAVVTTNGTPGSPISGGSYTNLFCVSETGNYVMKKSTQDAYVNGDSDFYGMGITNIAGSGNKVLYLEGSIDGGTTVTQVSTVGTAVTYTTPENVYTQDGKHKDLYSLEKITFKGQVSGSPDTNITYNYFVVPAEVTAERSVHLNANENAILRVIPALAIIAVLVGVLAVAIRGRE